MNELTTYTPASIARIETIDEGADLAKRMQALAYAIDKAKGKHENAQKARAMYLLAARRTGELLSEVPRSNGGRPNSFEQKLVTLYQEAKEAAGVSNYIAHTWQKLAEIPTDTLESYLHDPKYLLTEFTINSLLSFANGKRTQVYTPESLIKTIGHYVKMYLDEFKDDRLALVRAWGEWMRDEWR